MNAPRRPVALTAAAIALTLTAACTPRTDTTAAPAHASPPSRAECTAAITAYDQHIAPLSGAVVTQAQVDAAFAPLLTALSGTGPSTVIVRRAAQTIVNDATRASTATLARDVTAFISVMSTFAMECAQQPPAPHEAHA